jgi:AraC family transcriptional regulator, regulatory protein of adaptative response / DNA-3-methyladenine glycosylase II
MILQRPACLNAVRSRDPRFDGLFFTAVKTTRIYCRPSCPANTAKDANMTFYPSAAAAQDAGYRACRRCRPDTVPGSPEWDVRADALARAMRLIGDGAIERDGVGGVAARLGYSTRQLQRITQAELGASPLALARSQRAHTARLLIETSVMPLAEVAFAAGFGSIRSFNDAIRMSFDRTPTELRARRAGGKHEQSPLSGPLGASEAHIGGSSRLSSCLARLDVRLAFRAPLAAEPLFGHLVATAVPGVEEWREGAYRRTLRLPHGAGIVELSPRAGHVAATLRLADPRDLTPAIGRCRRLLDLDADPAAVDEALAADEALAPLIARRPGARVPRTVDADELAVRIVLGQQVSTAAAATTTGRLAARLGDPVDDPAGGLTRLFPTMDALAAPDPAEIPGPKARAETVIRLAGTLASEELDLGPGADRDAARRTLASIRGVGAWTIELIAMRGLGDPDAFPATDLGLVRAMDAAGHPDPERWRPWRSYAAQYLWATLDHPINRLPADRTT